MRIAAVIAGKAIRLVNEMIDIAVLTAMMLLAAVGCYAIWDSRQVYSAASAAKYEIYKPTTENTGKSFAELQGINPDVFGWLTVYGTHIDYPLVQGQDNMDYINTSVEGRYSMSGSIFLDSKNSRHFSDFPSIIRGHHMEQQAMFGEIDRFAEKSFFDTRRYGMLYYDGLKHGLEFFAFVHADAYNDAVFRTKLADRSEQEAYLDMLLRMALYTREIHVSADDRIVLLATCSASSTNGRDVLVGRVTDDLYDDTFIVEDPDPKTGSVDRLPGLWAQAPFWAKSILLGLPLLLCAPLSIAAYGKLPRIKRYKGWH